MFFDVGFAEIFFLAVVGLLILGPERLPTVARTLGKWVRRGRQMASEFQRELEREVDLTEIKQLKNEVDKAAQPFRDAAETLDEGNSILDKTVRDASKPLATSGVDAVIPDTLEHHEPIPSTESSDLIDPESVEAVVPETISKDSPPAESGKA